MTLEEFSELLIELGGTTGKVLKNTLSSSNKPNSSFFFNRYKSAPAAGFKLASVFIAPISFSILALEYAIYAVVNFFSMFGNMVTGNFSEAEQNGWDTINAIILTCIGVLSAVISPVLNFIDLMGSSINSCRAPNPNDEASTASMLV